MFTEIYHSSDFLWLLGGPVLIDSIGGGTSLNSRQEQVGSLQSTLSSTRGKACSV